MDRRLAALALAGALAGGCATLKGGGGTTEEKQRIKNDVAFDLINCFPPKLEVPKPADEPILIGYWTAAQPHALECLVDPKSRGPEKATQVNVTTTTSESGTEVKVTGTNLTPDGQACIEGVFKAMPSIPALPKGRKAVTFTGQLQHNVDQSPAVSLGQNELSDMAGLIRLSEKTWCDCFEPWKASAPHPLKATLTVKKPATPNEKATTQVAFDPVTDPASQSVSSCLQGKLTALPFAVQSTQVSLPYTFFLTNSGAKAQEPDAPPNIQVMQLDGMRSQASVHTSFKFGNRANAEFAYDALVRKFKANSRSVTVKELKERCGAMLKAGDEYIAALQNQIQVEQETASVVGKLKAQDPRWTEADTAAQKSLSEAQKELEKAREIRSADEKACPRVKD